MKDLSGHSPSEIIQKLLDGELTSSESKKFSEMVNSNPEYKREFNDYKRIKESINSDKKQQLNSSIPDPALKNNIFKELGLGKAVETPVAIGGGSRLVQYGSATLSSTFTWLMNYKVSVPSMAVVTAFTFFALWNNGGNNSNINSNNNNNNLANKTNVVKSNDTKNIPVVSSNSLQTNTTKIDKFEDNLNNSQNTLANSESITKSKVKYNSKYNSNSNSKISNRDKVNNDKTKNDKVNNDVISIDQNNADKSKQTASIIKDDNKNVDNKELNNDNSNTLKDNSTLLLVENGIVYNSYSLTELRSSINKPNQNFNVITPLKSNRNVNNESGNLGATILFSGVNQLNNNEFTAAGFWKVNNQSNYIFELGVEFNRVFLAPFVIDPQGNNGKFDGVGIGGRFESNGLLSEFMGSTLGELINPYAGVSFGQVNPGLYSKLNAGVQLNVLQISNMNLQFTAGYEYFGLIQKSSQFQSSRQGIVTGIMVKF